MALSSLHGIFVLKKFIIKFTTDLKMKTTFAIQFLTLAATAAAEIESGQYTGASVRETEGNLQQQT